MEQPEQALTPREARIVRVLADGNSYQGVDRLDPVTTDRNYIRRIYETGHLHTKSEALRGRLIPEGPPAADKGALSCSVQGPGKRLPC